MNLHKSISVIIRVTEACNLRCVYCYIKTSTKNKFLPHSFFEKLIRELAELGYEYIDLIWHGGEPLLPGINYYKKVVGIENEVSEKYDTVFVNRLQTNGTLISQNWVDFFVQEGFKVGLSIDCSQEIHNNNRRYPNGNSTYNDVIQGLELLRNGGFNPTILSVLTREHLDQIDDYYLFIKDLNVGGFKANPCFINKQEQPHLQVLPFEWGRAMIKLFDIWFEDENPPSNREFQDIINSFFVGKSNLCMFNKTCFNNFISVIPSGDLFPCARFINEDTSFFLGNINEGIDFALKNYSALERNYNDIGCDTCKWETICFGGCSAYAYWASGSIDTKDFLCEGYKIFFQHVYDTVQNHV